MPEIDDYFSDSSAKSPIFFDFFGLTPMMIALKNRDYPSFYRLVEFMLAFQDNISNSYLVKDFLIKAIGQQLNINNQLQSNLCTCRLSGEDVEHYEHFPAFHSNSETTIVNFCNSQMELLHDEDVYDQVFGANFPFEEPPESTTGLGRTFVKRSAKG